MLKVIGKKEEQLQNLREQQAHMQTSMEQLQGDAKDSQALRAADKAAKAYAADLQAKVLLCFRWSLVFLRLNTWVHSAAVLTVVWLPADCVVIFTTLFFFFLTVQQSSAKFGLAPASHTCSIPSLHVCE